MTVAAVTPDWKVGSVNWDQACAFDGFGRVCRPGRG